MVGLIEGQLLSTVYMTTVSLESSKFLPGSATQVKVHQEYNIMLIHLLACVKHLILQKLIVFLFSGIYSVVCKVTELLLLFSLAD